MMSSEIKIFAVFGNPIGHSLSPLMHQAALDRMDIQARYVPFRVTDIRKAVEGIRGLGIQGVSVTLPFKTEVMEYLDEIEENALRIGAVNTIWNDQGILKGYNTDWLGFVLSLKEGLEITVRSRQGLDTTKNENRTDRRVASKPIFALRGKRFAVIGAGGAARGVVYGLVQEGGIPIILNRTLSGAKALGKEFGCPYFPLSEKDKIDAEGLINTTSLGMAPNTEESPFPRELLDRFSWVMDIIYNPLKTKLLREAEEVGCRIITGLGMFVHQGAEQIKIWTGQEPPRDLMREAVAAELRENVSI
ncbi:MAG: shikimate dehydrogenase [Deltaproteobacteria bacterium]|nr:shikimate dehydrogenase [Deltaproteobacteria bacterium]